jgi:hypothetical protein
VSCEFEPSHRTATHFGSAIEKSVGQGYRKALQHGAGPRNARFSSRQLPTLSHIVNRLAELKLGKCLGAG